MKQKLFRFLRPRLAFLLAAALVAGMVPNLPMTVEADAPTATWEDRTGVYGETFTETATSVTSYTYYDADGNAETVTVDSTTALGSKTNPISISSEADLILFGQQSYDDTAGKYYILDKDGSGGTYDMDGENYSMLPLFATLKSNASSMYSYSDFRGVLIGNGSSITNVYIRGEDSGYLTSPGLFGTLYGTDENPCEIMDITVKMTIGSVSSDCYTYVGGLAAEAYGTVSLSNVTVDVTVSDGGTDYTYFGGLIGYTDYGDSGSDVNISNCDVIPSVSESATVGYYGGLIGYVTDGASATITDCAVTADNIQAYYFAGGLVAYASYQTSITAENCTVVADGGIVALGDYYAYAGGLVAYVSYSTITAEDCTVTAGGGIMASGSDNNYGEAYAGGLMAYAGYQTSITAENCTVTADGGIVASGNYCAYAGTLVGEVYENSTATFTGCTADTVLTKNTNNVYWPTAAIGKVEYYQSPPTLTYSDTISTIRLGSSSNVYVALVNGTALTSASEDSGTVTAYVSASGNGTTGSATATSDGDVTLNVDVANANTTYSLSSFTGIIYLEDNTGSSYSPEAYWATLDTGSTFTNVSGSLSTGDGVNLLVANSFRYTVTFDSMGGSSVDSQVITSGGTVTEPTAPTKDGYEFEGWYAEAAFDTEWDFDTAVTASVTLYARFTLTVEITTEPTANELTYNGSAQELVSAGEASGGTMYYSLTGDDGDWSTDIPTGTDAGTYTVYYKAVDSDNGTETEFDSVSVTIGQAVQSISYDATSVSKTEGGESFINGLTETLVYGDITYTSSDTSVATVGSDGTVTILGAGTATITATASGSDNYTAATASYTLTITESSDEDDVTITSAPAALESLTYSGSAQTLITAGTASGGTMYYSLTGNDGDWSTDIPNGTDEGTYTVYYKAIGSDEETETDVASVSVTIGQAAQAISYDTSSVSKTVGDESFTNGLTETLVYGSITYSSSDTSVATVDSDGQVTIVGAGTATITATVSGSDNYTAATATYTLTITESSGSSNANDGDTNDSNTGSTGNDSNTGSTSDDNSSESSAADENDDDTSDSVTESTGEDSGSDSSDAVVVAEVQSGDNTNLLLWVVLLLLVASGLAVTVIYRRKNTHRK